MFQYFYDRIKSDHNNNKIWGMSVLSSTGMDFKIFIKWFLKYDINHWWHCYGLIINHVPEARIYIVGLICKSLPEAIKMHFAQI